MSTPGRDTEDPIQPQSRNPAADPDTSPEKQSELKLNVGIGILGTIMSVAVVIIFFILEEPVMSIAMAVVAIVSAVVTVYAFVRRRRGQEEAARRNQQA